MSDSIHNTLEQIRSQISPLTETPGLDAQVLLAHIYKRERSWLLAHSDEILSPDATLRLTEAMAQLTSGIPLPYVIGEWEFFGLPFIVTPHVLIPRPETELLVETAIEWLIAHPECRIASEAGTGSGCIAVSLAVNIPDLQVSTTDISPEAVTIAQKNAGAHQVETRVTVQESDLLKGLSGPIDLICANLPYIPSADLRQIKVFHTEPTIALDGGEVGLEIIARLLVQAVPLLSPGGLILLEIGAGQGEAAKALATDQFPFASIQVKPDLSGHDRLLVIQT